MYPSLESRFQNFQSYRVHVYSLLLLNHDRILPFLELCECAIFDAGICSADALQSLALLPNGGRVAPLSVRDQCLSAALEDSGVQPNDTYYSASSKKKN